MKERDYIYVTNKTKIQAALAVLRDILPGEEYLENSIGYRKAVSQLYDIADKMHDKMPEITEG